MNFKPEFMPMPVFALMAFGVILYYVWTKHKERMEIIKKGDSRSGDNESKQLKHSVLSKAILFISLAVGLIVGSVIQINLHFSSIIIYTTSMLLFGGIGLLVYYFILSKSK